jgi:hypothetical protein
MFKKLGDALKLQTAFIMKRRLDGKNTNVEALNADVKGKDVVIYTVSGQIVGSTKGNGNQISLITNIKKGEIAIIKIGEKTLKTVMQ